MLPLISIITKKQALFLKLGADLFRWGQEMEPTYTFEVSIQTIYIKKFPQWTITGLITT